MEIYNVSAGFIQLCENFLGQKQIDSEGIFKRLSLEMGGDGESITKDQLNNYINKAESGNIKVDKSKLQALKKIQENWNSISNGDDSITYDEMSNHVGLLLATVSSDVIEIVQNTEEKTSKVDAIYDYLTDYLGLSSKDDVKESDLTSYLNDIIAGASDEDDSDSELIGTLINLIDAPASKSTVEVEA